MILNIKESVAGQAYDALYNKIACGAWKIGEKIPNEFELCSQLGASRISVRSAVQKLVALGMLEVKRGDGTYVKRFSLQDYLQEAVPFIIQSEDRQEMIQFREALESTACKIAIELHNEAEIDELERLFYISNEAFKANNVSEYVTDDLNFHRQLCAMSHNKIIVTMWDAFVKPLGETIRENVSPLLASGRFVDDHHLHLAQAIRAGETEKALHLLHMVLYGFAE